MCCTLSLDFRNLSTCQMFANHHHCTIVAKAYFILNIHFSLQQLKKILGLIAVSINKKTFGAQTRFTVFHRGRCSADNITKFKFTSVFHSGKLSKTCALVLYMYG